MNESIGILNRMCVEAGEGTPNLDTNPVTVGEFALYAIDPYFEVGLFVCMYGASTYNEVTPDERRRVLDLLGHYALVGKMSLGLITLTACSPLVDISLEMFGWWRLILPE